MNTQNKFLVMILMAVMVFTFQYGVVGPRRQALAPSFIQTRMTTCLHETPQPIQNCLYAIPANLVIPTTNGSITPNNYIQVRYSVNGSTVLGWVAVNAVKLIYIVH